MLLSIVNGCLAVLTLSLLAFDPMQGQQGPASGPPPVCTDGCAATATVVNLPAGTCGANMPTYAVDWGQSTSGHCEGCTLIFNCNNHAKITITPVGGTNLNGGGFSCNGAGGTVSAQVDTCGQASTSQIHVHTGSPCTDVNYSCTVYVTIGCKNC